MKNLCKLNNKEIENNLSKIKELVEKPKYICTRCARASKDKKTLCKPEKISKKKS